MQINWKKIFDWSVCGIQRPYEIRTADKIVAYRVDVMYRHHGLRPVMFPVERDRVFISGKEIALSRATKFFDKMYAKMQRDIKKR